MSCSQPICNLNVRNVYGNIFTVDVNGVPSPVLVNLALLIQYITCAVNKFTSITGDLPTEVRAQLDNIITETGNATEEVILIVSAGLFILLFLLVLTIFAAIYWRDVPYAIPLLLFLAIFFIIVVVVVIYFWVSSIYNTSATNIGLFITNLNNLFTLTGTAVLPAFCCFGGVNCGPGDPCGCTRPV